MNNATYYRYGLGLQYQFKNSPQTIGTNQYQPIEKLMDYTVSPAPSNLRYIITDYPDPTIDVSYINQTTKPDVHKINIPMGVPATGLTTFTKDGLFTIDGANRITNKQKEPTIRLAPNVFHSAFIHYRP
jgi:hypothetical protein